MHEATQLTCVKCTSVLDRADFEGLEVDLCPSCGGLWLDRGEITRAARLPETELRRLRDLIGAANPAAPIGSENHIPCPACPGLLAEFSLGSIRVECCSACHGIFLDRGELEEALSAVRAHDNEVTGREMVDAAVSATDSSL
jgi:Zn-finger nucleic acid-binding protein